MKKNSKVIFKFATKAILVSATALFLISCQRAKKDTSTVTIELPTLDAAGATPVIQQSASDMSILISTMGVNDGPVYEPEPPSLDVDAWSALAPNGLTASSSRPVNCYAVFAGVKRGVVEPRMQYNSCGRELNGVMYKTFFFGPWVGAIRADAGVAQSRVELEVPSGADRVFTIIGFHATAPSECVNFKTDSIKKYNISRPFILGTSAPVKLEGDSQPVEIDVALDESKFFDDCEIVESKDQVNEGTPVALHISKNEEPAGLAVVSQCFPLDVRLIDDQARVIRSSTDTNVALLSGDRGDTDPVSPNSHVIATSFDTAALCENGIGGVTTFKIPAGSELARRWTRAASGISIVHDFRLTTVSHVPAMTSPVISVRVKGAATKFFEVLGPAVARQSQCVPYSILIKNAAGAESFTDQYMIAATMDPMASTGPAHTVWANDTCTVSLPTWFQLAEVTPAAEYRKTVYVKLLGTVGQTQGLVVQSQGVTPQKTTYLIRSGDGTLVPKNLRILSSIKTVVPGTCQGPFKVAMVNDLGVVIPRPLKNGTLPLLTIPINGEAGMAFYQHKDSSQGCIDPTANVTFPLGATYSDEFYMKMTGPSDGTNRIEIETDSSNSGSALRARYEMN